MHPTGHWSLCDTWLSRENPSPGPVLGWFHPLQTVLSSQWHPEATVMVAGDTAIHPATRRAGMPGHAQAHRVHRVPRTCAGRPYLRAVQRLPQPRPWRWGWWYPAPRARQDACPPPRRSSRPPRLRQGSETAPSPPPPAMTGAEHPDPNRAGPATAATRGSRGNRNPLCPSCESL